MARTAVILFNLGGPDGPAAVEPFLFNLFFDPAIIGAPGPIRWMLAKWLARRRAPVARAIYAQLGGGSPLLPQTEAQARALSAVLGPDHGVFVAMRYWHPFVAEAAKAAKAWGAEQVVLLPLYPQFSTTTSQSSVAAWARATADLGWQVPTRAVCCYPTEPGLIHAMAELVAAGYRQAEAVGRPRVLFSAHGLPRRVVERGDPYPLQVVQTATAVAAAAGIAGLDWVVCYQSRVGPLEWIGPSIDQELERAGRDGIPVVVVPVAFVSEHSETLVELDMEYRHRAESLGLPGYVRVATVGSHPAFIAGLAGLVRDPATGQGQACASAGRDCACKGMP